jgi:hypothetical protein
MRWNHLFKEAVGLGFLGLLLPVAGVAAAEDEANKEVSGTIQVQSSDGKTEIKTGTLRLNGKTIDVGGKETIKLIVDEGSGSASATAGTAVHSESSGYWIGAGCRPVPDALRAQLELPKGQGLVVEQLAPDGPAAKAGVQAFDVLFTANDTPLGEPSDLVKAVDAAKDGEITLQLFRTGKKMTVAVKPAQRPKPDRDVMRFVPDQEAWQKWLESMPKPPAGGGTMGPGGPMQFRVFNGPGMVMPLGPGGPGTMTFTGGRTELPDNMTVTITRQGKEPAKITVKQGEDSWDVTEDQLDKLPEKIRGLVRPMVGGLPGKMTITARAFPAPGPDGAGGGGFGGAMGGTFERRVPPPGEAKGNGDDRLEQRLEELGHRMDDLRDAIKDLRNSRARRDAPQAQPPQAQAPKDGT